jgi:hypothetical protein
MDKIMIALGGIIVGLLVVAGVALLGGTIVYWIWPAVIPIVFPAGVASGALAGSLLWWKAVLLTWLCGILFKGSGSTSTNKK